MWRLWCCCWRWRWRWIELHCWCCCWWRWEPTNTCMQRGGWGGGCKGDVVGNCIPVCLISQANRCCVFWCVSEPQSSAALQTTCLRYLGKLNKGTTEQKHNAVIHSLTFSSAVALAGSLDKEQWLVLSEGVALPTSTNMLLLLLLLKCMVEANVRGAKPRIVYDAHC